MDCEQSSLCGSFRGQKSFDSWYGLDLASTSGDEQQPSAGFVSFDTESVSGSNSNSTTTDNNDLRLNLNVRENLFEELRLDFDSVRSRRQREVVSSNCNSTAKKLIRANVERIETPTESQLKLGNIYALLNKARYKSNSYRYPTVETSLEDYFSGENCDISANREKFEFDNVCADLSQSINSFLAETYIKSLLGVFPYNNLSKRRSRGKGNSKQNKSRSTKRRKLSSSSTLTSTSLA